MNELLGLLLAVVVIGALVALAAKAVNRVAWRIESALSLVSSGIILAAMLFVSAEVISRKLFNAPIPGHLELSELLMPAIIFLAVAYTQSTGGHVRMTLFIHRLEPVTRRYVEIAIRLLSVLIYAVLCYYSAKHAYRSWIFDDVTMSPPYFLIWPSAITRARTFERVVLPRFSRSLSGLLRWPLRWIRLFRPFSFSFASISADR